MAIGMTSAVYLTGAKEEIARTVSSGCFAVKDTLREMWPTLSFDRPEESRALGSFAVTMIAWRVVLIIPKEVIARTGFWSLLGVLL